MDGIVHNKKSKIFGIKAGARVIDTQMRVTWADPSLLGYGGIATNQ